MCILTTSSIDHSLISLPLLRPPYFLRHNDIEIKPINNNTMTLKCSSKRESHISLSLNQKLKMMKLSEESCETRKEKKPQEGPAGIYKPSPSREARHSQKSPGYSVLYTSPTRGYTDPEERRLSRV